MHSERIIEIFLDLIKIDATSGNEKPVAAYITSFLSKIGLEAYSDNSGSLTNSNTGNVICQIGNGGNFLLSSHMDTARHTGNVKVIFENGKIQSDGSTVLGVDNRAGIAVILYLLEYISEKKLATKDFTAAFTTCEETTIAGSRFIDLNENISEAYVFDSYMRPGYFVNKSSGAVTFNAEVFGKASHAGIEPEAGISAILIASKVISELALGRVNKDTTINIGKIEGGSAVNVIPENVNFKGEIRSTVKSEIYRILDELKAKLETTAEKYGGGIDFSYKWDFEPFYIDENINVYKNLKSAMQNAGLKFLPELSMGGSDANSFNARGINALNLGIGAQNPHSNDEYILIEDLEKSFELALELVKI